MERTRLKLRIGCGRFSCVWGRVEGGRQRLGMQSVSTYSYSMIYTHICRSMAHYELYCISFTKTCAYLICQQCLREAARAAASRENPADRGPDLLRKSYIYDNDNFLFSLIDGCSSISEIVQLMNDGYDKSFGWNFLNLLHDGKTTIGVWAPSRGKNCYRISLSPFLLPLPSSHRTTLTRPPFLLPIPSSHRVSTIVISNRARWGIPQATDDCNLARSSVLLNERVAHVGKPPHWSPSCE